MSTKASIKRIALIAMSGLGLGLLSVVPANAAAANPVLTAAKASAKTQTVSVGSPASVTVSFTTGAAIPNGDTWGAGGATKEATVTVAAPIESTVTLADNNGAGTGGTSVFSTTGMTTGLGSTMNTTTGAITGTATAAVAAGAVTAGTVSITPDVPGLYQIWIATDDVTYKSYIWAWATATNGATLVGIQGDGGYPSANANINGVAGPFNQVTVRAFAATTTANVRRLVTVEGAGAFFASASTGGASGVVPTFPTGTSGWTAATIAPAAYAASDLDYTLWTDFNIATPTAGTVTVKLFNETSTGSNIFSGTASATLTITVASTGSAGVVSTALSTVFGNTDNTTLGNALTDAAVPSSVLAALPAGFKVKYDIRVRDALGALRALSNTALTATIEGPGLLNSTNSNVGLARVVVIPWDPSSTTASDPIKNAVYLFNDGTAGKSTLTIYWGSTVLATKTITFTGSARTLTANVWEPHITVGTVSDALEIIAKDSLGNITTYTPTALSSAPSVVSNSLGSCYRAVAADAVYGYTPGGYYCPVTGLSVGTATLTIAPGSLTTNSPTVDYRVTKSAAADVTLTADKASYAPGEKITLTLTVKDADGQLLGARDTKYLLLSSDLAATSSLSGTPFCGSNALTTTCKKSDGLPIPSLIPNPGVAISAGTAKTSYFAPLVSGPVTFSATVAGADVATAYQVTPIKVTVSVTETSAEAAANAAADAAAEAIDAANAATDAANLAAEAADAATVAAEEARDAADAATAAIEELATQVATLMAALKAQITTLANTVAKIAKKIKA